MAIDGPAGSGKSSAARLVARRLGFILLDTGAIYRALALAAQEQGCAWDDEPALARLALDLPVNFRLRGEQNRVLLGDRDVSEAIRTPEVSRGASQVSAHPSVRAALLERQRSFADRASIVAEGRDMGTVVFPEAAVKVFLDANDEVRALRRQRELAATGHALPIEEVLRQQRQRDEADRQRDASPMRPAADAVVLDTSALTLDEVVDRILALAASAGAFPVNQELGG